MSDIYATYIYIEGGDSDGETKIVFTIAEVLGEAERLATEIAKEALPDAEDFQVGPTAMVPRGLASLAYGDH